jgi:hypothetical protein
MPSRRNRRAIVQALADGDIAHERLLLAVGFRLAIGLDVARILAARQPRELGAPAAEDGLQALLRHRRQGADRLHAERGEPCARDRADAEDASDRKRCEECRDLVGGDGQQAVGFGEVAGDLRDHLHRRDPDRDREPGLATDLGAQTGRHRDRITEEAGASGHVEERLVERQRLDRGREAGEDREDSAALATVFPHVAGNEDGVRAETACLEGGHRGMDAEGACLVARRGDDAAGRPSADDHRAAAQRGVVALLDGGEEGVHIGVEEDARHRTGPTQRLVTAIRSLYTAARRTWTAVAPSKG